MSTILQKARQRYERRVAEREQALKSAPSDTAKETEDNRWPTPVRVNYTSLPVDIPDDFLAPLPDPSAIKVEVIDFPNSVLPEYKNLYAVVLDNVLSKEECDQLLLMAEMSQGAHLDDDKEGPENDGWQPARVNAGRNYEVLAKDYRNSDRIVWDQAEVTKRLWKRCLQGKGMEEYLSQLEGRTYLPIGVRKGEKWVVTENGLNERMRYLKYGKGQFFKEHCDGVYETEDGSSRSFFTYHLYLNDSAQALGIPKSMLRNDPPTLLRGGATTFHSGDLKRRIDVDPKIGRVLLFQHRRLLHSGDEVTNGIKYTMRSDLMFKFDSVDEGDGDVVFG